MGLRFMFKCGPILVNLLNVKFIVAFLARLGSSKIKRGMTSDEPWIPEGRKAQLMDYFAKLNVYGVLIHGHTDARASDAYNMRLSQRRADMVSGIAQAAGVNVVESRGFGERRPAQAGHSAAALQANRRVEIICLK